MDAKIFAIIFLCTINRINTQQYHCPSQCNCIKSTVICTNITSMPSSIPPNTKILDIRHGNVSTLHPTIGTSQIHTLLLHDNKITTIQDGYFQSLPALRYIYLNDNHLLAIHNHTFAYCRNVHTLILDGNRVRNIDVGAFERLNKLKVLSLARNPIQNIHRNHIKSWKNSQLQRLNMQNVPLRCDCYLAHFRQYLKVCL
jgi:Leucine-rich repeat (LRR) protein